MWPVYFTLVLSSVIFVSDVADCAFSRQCEHAGNCVFEPKGSNDRVYLDCKERMCTCSKFLYIADVPAWNLQMENDGKCMIAEGGPCGSDRGLDVACQPNADCVQGRCRKSEKVGTRKEGELCNEDIDCLKELKCSVTSFYFQPTRRCTNKTYVSSYENSENSGGYSMEQELETSTLDQSHDNHAASIGGGNRPEVPITGSSGTGTTSGGGSSTKSAEMGGVKSREVKTVSNHQQLPSPPETAAASGTGHADKQTKVTTGHADAQPQQNAGPKMFTISSLLLPFILVWTVVVVGGGAGEGLMGLNC